MDILGLVGPSGVGKGFVKAQINERFRNTFREPIVVTTRPKRLYPEPDRMAGISQEEFQTMYKLGQVLFAHQPFGANTDSYGFLATNLRDRSTKLVTEVHIDNIVPFKDEFGNKLFLIGLVADEEYLSLNLDKRNSETPEDKARRLSASQREVSIIKAFFENGRIDHLVEITMRNRSLVLGDTLMSIISANL